MIMHQIPNPVLGGATSIMFGTVAAGICIEINRRFMMKSMDWILLCKA